MEEKYTRIFEIVKKELEDASSAHDMSHVVRVYNMCLYLAKYEHGVDLDILKTAALLHDIARVKESRDVDHTILGADISDKILRELAYPESLYFTLLYSILAKKCKRLREFDLGIILFWENHSVRK